MDPLPLVFSSAVDEAKAAGRPIVALESTIIAHGMPHPVNLETARELEAIIGAEGAVAATIAVLDGAIHVGLDAAQLQRVAGDLHLPKLSRRDLPAAIAAGTSGATTVAATMIAAHLAGIAVFATGGIGGVHRGAEQTFDISTDLEELARTPVAVVCAGAKAILDLPKTLEALETRGVPVAGYGSDRFPAFYTRDSGLAAPLRIDTPGQAAALIRAQRRLGYAGGTLIAAPLPVGDALRNEDVDAAIATALGEAAAGDIGGKELTPFLLARLNALTGGRTLTANIALARNNARIAARIAGALTKT